MPQTHTIVTQTKTWSLPYAKHLKGQTMTVSPSHGHLLPSVEILDLGTAYQIRRMFCVGRNYAEHAAEMGAEVDREAPFYFTKSAFAFAKSGSTIAYPPGTENLHHEVELVVAIGAPVFKCDEAQALAAIHAYGCGLDMTRRDLQQVAKDKRRPWDTGKDFENSAILSPMVSTAKAGPLAGKRIHLNVNDEKRQSALLDDMVWSVEEIIMHLSTLYHLAPGDLIMTGTPAGVGAVSSGDTLKGGIDGLPDIRLLIGDAE